MTHLVFVNRFFYPDHSATSQLLQDLTFALAQDKTYRVSVVTSAMRYDDARAKLPHRQHFKDVDIYRVRSTRFGRHWLPGRLLDYLTFYLSCWWRVRQLTDRDTIVVAKTDPPMLSVLLTGTVIRKGGKMLNWLQDVFPEVAAALGVRGLSGALGNKLKQWRDASLKKAQNNVVLGQCMREYFLKRGISQTTVIPNWSNAESITPKTSESTPLRRQWRLTGKFVVMYSGNMGRGHPLEVVVGAAQRLKDKPVEFLWVGDGPKRAWLKQQAQQLGLTNMTFQPYQPREALGDSLAVGDIHLVSLEPELEGLMVPSKYYGIAAAGRGCIYLGSAKGELGRLIEENQTGVVIDPKNENMLVETIGAMLENQEQLHQYGQHARDWLEQNASEELAIRTWQQLISEIQ